MLEENGKNNRWHGVIVSLLSIAGIVNAIELAKVHYGVHVVDGFQSFCHFGEGWSCDRVAASAWSVFLGLPVAYWGFLGYCVFGVLGILVARAGKEERQERAGTLLAIALGALGVSALLMTISVFAIGAACPLCTLAHGLNLAIALVAGHAAFRAGGVRVAVATGLRAPRRFGALVGLPFAIGLLLAISIPSYWSVSNEPLVTDDGLAFGITEDGSPWIGAQNPTLTIVEFSDYQCPHCRRQHQELRQFVTEHSDCVRLVHCSYPLDQQCNSDVPRPYHDRACEAAMMAHCSGEQGQFWAANDFLFNCMGRTDHDQMCSELGLDRSSFEQCLSSEETEQCVRRNLSEGRQHGVRATPSFLVDGQLYVGRVPQEVLDSHLHRESGV